MTGRLTVHPLSVMMEAKWGFRDGVPRWHSGPYGHATEFDPFPAYAHSLAEAIKAAQHVERQVRPLWNVDIWLADREEVSRSNGHSHLNEGGHYEGTDWVKDPPTSHVVLSGKRIPPHPAMTHYLVAHEMGHHIEYMLQYLRDPSHVYNDDVLREYLEVRGLPAEQHLHHGEGGTWHDAGSEIFACDFRIVVCKVETDFWPHHGITYPDSRALDDWWAAAIAALADNDTNLVEG